MGNTLIDLFPLQKGKSTFPARSSRHSERKRSPPPPFEKTVEAK